MLAQARVAVAADGPRTRLLDARSEPPLAIRRCGDGRVLLVGSAAGPVGGDELSVEVDVGDGAHLHVGTAAATIAWPGRDGTRSTTRTTATVGAHASLRWHPEPLLSVAGSRHDTTTIVDLHPTATCVIAEEVSLGRCGEACGDVGLDLLIRRGGATVLRHVERLGPAAPGWGGAALVGAARHLVAVAVVGPPAGAVSTVVGRDVAAAWLPLTADVALALAVGPDRPTTLAALDGRALDALS